MTSLRTLEMGWQILLQKHPERLLEESTRQTQKVGLVIFGSDWGMCGHDCAHSLAPDGDAGSLVNLTKKLLNILKNTFTIQG